MTDLKKFTIETLEYKLTTAAEMIACGDDSWIETQESIERVLSVRTVESLSDERDAQDEVENYLELIYSDYDVDAEARRDQRALIVDLCRCGYFNEKNPNAFSTRAIKTRRVDGKTYEVGY